MWCPSTQQTPWPPKITLGSMRTPPPSHLVPPQQHFITFQHHPGVHTLPNKTAFSPNITIADSFLTPRTPPTSLWARPFSNGIYPLYITRGPENRNMPYPLNIPWGPSKIALFTYCLHCPLSISLVFPNTIVDRGVCEIRLSLFCLLVTSCFYLCT